MRILVAPNAFKGSLTVLEAARALAKGAKAAFPDAEIMVAPISDGGDGLIDALLAAGGGRRLHAPARGPLGEKRQAPYGWLGKPRPTGIVETALASGLALVPPGRREPLEATCFGTGQLIDAALRRGARTLIVGLGGAACSDGGAGLAQALGVRLLDKDGRELPAGVEALERLWSIDASALKKRLRGVKVFALTDVTNPLLGPRGSARTYGPQKGAAPEQVELIERALTRYARLIKRDVGADVAGLPGAGAAGGSGAALVAFLGARLVPGADYVIGKTGISRLLARADAVLTGEGRLDATSFFGKAPVELAQLARRAGVPTACVCGACDEAAAGRAKEAGMDVVATLTQAGARGEDSLRRAAHWAAKAAELALKKLAPAAAACCLLLAAPRAGQAAPDLKRIDALYFQRDKPGKLDESLTEIDAQLRKDPGDARLLWRKGRTLLRQGEGKEKKKDKLELFARARDVLQEAAANAPKDADAHFWLGVTLGRWGQTRGILKSLSMIGPLKREMAATLKLDPGYGGAHHVLGELYTQLPGFAGGDKKKALEEFELAYKADPDYLANYPSLAKAYLKAGRKDDARAALQECLAVTAPGDLAEAKDDRKDCRDLLGQVK